jgi:hypothetical protein
VRSAKRLNFDLLAWRGVFDLLHRVPCFFVQNMSTEKPLIYLILGAAGSGRREVLSDLIDGGLAEGDKSVVLLSAGEAASDHDAKLGAVKRWSMTEGIVVAPEDALADGVTHAFVVTDGRSNPVDQIEAFKSWIEENGGELGRVLCVVNCKLAEAHHELVAWYQACIHFSDIVLLNRRDGVANKWLSDFQNRFKDQFYPCLFEFVKGGKVKNPALILDPQPRRLSHYFDEPEWLVEGKDAEDGVEMGEGDGDEPGGVYEEEVEVTQAEDPYMERRVGGGRRLKEIPPITKFLES